VPIVSVSVMLTVPTLAVPSVALTVPSVALTVPSVLDSLTGLVLDSVFVIELLAESVALAVSVAEAVPVGTLEFESLLLLLPASLSLTEALALSVGVLSLFEAEFEFELDADPVALSVTEPWLAESLLLSNSSLLHAPNAVPTTVARIRHSSFFHVVFMTHLLA
jgi:hypothetical protein